MAARLLPTISNAWDVVAAATTIGILAVFTTDTATTIAITVMVIA